MDLEYLASVTQLQNLLEPRHLSKPHQIDGFFLLHMCLTVPFSVAAWADHIDSIGSTSSLACLLQINKWINLI